MRPASGAEQERERHADELHDDERGNLRVAVDADLGAVDRRHPDDRLDAVVVEQERDQHQERVAGSRAARETSRARAANATRTGLRAGRLVGLEDRRRLRHAAKQRNREHQPPDGDADERQLDRRDGVGQAERRAGCRIHARLTSSSDAAAEEPDRVAGGRDAVDLVRRGDVRQQRVVEDQARGDADVGDDEDDARAYSQSPRSIVAISSVAMTPMAMKTASSRFFSAR